MSSNAHVVRREFVRTALGMLALAPFAARSFAQDAAGIEERIEFRRLVAANRILAHEETCSSRARPAAAIPAPVNHSGNANTNRLFPWLLAFTSGVRLRNRGVPVLTATYWRPSTA